MNPELKASVEKVIKLCPKEGWRLMGGKLLRYDWFCPVVMAVRANNEHSYSNSNVFLAGKILNLRQIHIIKIATAADGNDHTEECLKIRQMMLEAFGLAQSVRS